MGPVSIATIQKLENFALQPMEISKKYNSVPVKGPGLSDDVI